MCNITIDGQALTVSEGSTILQAAERVGIRIPTLCFFKSQGAVSSCRMCVVEVEGVDHPVPACSTPVWQNMVIETTSEQLTAYRRVALELLVEGLDWGSKAADLTSCREGCTELEALCREYGVSGSAAVNPSRPLVEGNPFLQYDPNKCIMCFRCVGACNERAHNHVLQAGKKGIRTTIDAPFGSDWKATVCESCGNCAQVCPTGAMALKRYDVYTETPTGKVRTTCPHCGVGCQIDLVVQEGAIVNAEGAPGPSNKSLLCVKGRSASFSFVDAPDRLRTPLIKNHETGEFEPATWEDALDLVASRFTELRDAHGGESLAAFACSRSTNEDVYLFQKMARTALRTNNIDSCARV